MTEPTTEGPLAGLRVLELGGMGPGPFATMLLADLGADVVRIDRPGGTSFFPGGDTQNLLNRGKRSVALDLKDPDGLAVARRLARHAHAAVEGFRPGVAERLGVGPEDLWRDNPALVYGRMTGWGPDGPRATTAGHDINYIAITGALHAIGGKDGPPQVPLNLLGDFAGGGMYLVVGILAALREADRTGRGQVVDAAIVDGVGHLLASTRSRVATGDWTDRRGTNMLDGGAAPFYGVYETSDGEHVAVGAIEVPFYAALIGGLGLDEPLDRQHDRAAWPALRSRIAARFRERTQAEWAATFDHTDACVSPVRSLLGASDDPQLAARGALVEQDGILQPARAPRFSGHRQGPVGRPPRAGEHTEEVLDEWLVTDDRDSG
ncbi:CaiB/BaiF CoA transferase family protein [Actinophytocola oryzae]|uniref:Alpha-methylacyl-CoA racemase n=1 Tax=Actinophytocola oryzae TaxID=502181 RepID=A0A4R7W215_9PSEU|nr:CaiB/BaiF CoA-transferase family protein [Actinophytocola oryzae]TDV56534.1 alpha-methylacyl-CoA racemase [Actinophytocola oryzae]